MASSPDLLVDRIAVVVPVHNEDVLITRCLDSIRHAASNLSATLRQPPRAEVIVVLDGCRDRTAALIASRGDIEVLTIDERCVGAARRAGADAALARARHPAATWLANTDADSFVPPDWLIVIAGHARAGIDVVLGTVEPTDGIDPALLHRWRSGYRAAEGHRHIHGANLGISGAAYSRIGGWADRTTGEDVDLVSRAEAARLRIARTCAIPVRTSHRTVGRAPHGFAAHLKTLAAGPL